MGWLAVGLANEVAAKLTIDVMKAGEVAAKKKASREVITPGFIEIYRQRMTTLDKLKIELRKTFGGPDPKVIIFIDELDRCRPDYAVLYLETVKHVFDVNGLVFILAIDYPHLACSVKSLYGDLDFAEYFRKFCHRRVALVKASPHGLGKLVSSYTQRYFSLEGRGGRFRPDLQIDKRIREISFAFGMRPRQLQEAF